MTAVTRRWTKRAWLVPAAVVFIALMTLPPLWLGRFVPENLRRPEAIPDYWNEAAEHLDNQGDATRVLVVPGSDFASYRWGNTVDPVLPGLMDRPSVQRELIPYGSPASANLLNAFDLGLQEHTADPAALAPIARLMRAGEVARAERPAVRAVQHAAAPELLAVRHRQRPGWARPPDSGLRRRTSPSRTSSSRTS